MSTMLNLEAPIREAADLHRGRPAPPENRNCWYCWCPLRGDAEFERSGRAFCSLDHERAFFGGGRSPIPEHIAADLATARRRLSRAEGSVRSAEDDMADAERDLQRAEDELEEAREDLRAVESEIELLDDAALGAVLGRGDET